MIMDKIFYWILNMSILASLCGCFVLLIRLIKPIPRKIFLFFWAIPFLRFFIPFAPAMKYSLAHLITLLYGKSVEIPHTGFLGSFSMMNSIQGAESYFPIVFKTDVLKRIFYISGLVWLIGSLVLILTFLVIYIFTSKELKSATHLRDNIYISNKITSPALYGIIKPKIVLPPHFLDKRVDYIIMHEEAHLKRGDNLLRIIAFLAAAIHWFNPLSWLFLKLFYTDLELACDECIIGKMDIKEKKEYAHTLVSSVEKTNIFASTFGGAKIRLRIENIFSYKRLSVFSITALVIFLGILSIFLLTNG